MFIKWIHHLLNPHCPDCRQEKEEIYERKEHERACSSCEILRQQLAFANETNRHLIESITRKENDSPPSAEAPNIVKPAFIPWRVRRQQLEAEDRVAAETLRKKKEEIAAGLQAVKSVPEDEDIKELEREMKIVETEREEQNAS